MTLRRAAELEFLPAALEIEETPPLPAARWLLWTIVACALAAVAWSVIGRVDIVGIAPGIVVTTGRSKLVQPHASAVVSRLHVREGQRVLAGELLVELDDTAVRAEAARLREECTSLALDAARLAQLVAATGAEASRARAVVAELVDQPAPRAAARRRATQQFELQLAEYRAALASLAGERREKAAARAALAARITQLARTLPLVTEAAEAHRTLSARGVVSRIHWLEVERERIGTEQELAARRDEAAALDAAMHALDERRAATAAQYRARWSGEGEELQRRLASCREARANNERARALTRLTAPIGGTVQQLAIHTPGGVVTPAQPLMLIAPTAAPLEVEARITQRDIGFVRIGQAAAVKLEAYDYTRYGYAQGRLARLSRDAVLVDGEEPYFLAQIALDDTRLQGQAQRLALEPGMRATVELAMGRRRIVEFLLSPLLRYGAESARER